ncbi:hypothetical protein ACPV5G_16185 [Photobacterium damselae]|uniref:hypothetical protein n=1 Tax=Photobacterium damselae TaxID=38293 RepID=UPI004068DD46
MLFSQDDALESFVYSLSDAVAIRDQAGNHVLVNDKWYKITHLGKGIKLDDVIESCTLPLIKTNLQYCKQCDDIAFEHYTATANYEVFDSVRYVTYRCRVEYCGQPMLLIIATELKRTPK